MLTSYYRSCISGTLLAGCSALVLLDLLQSFPNIFWYDLSHIYIPRKKSVVEISERRKGGRRRRYIYFLVQAVEFEKVTCSRFSGDRTLMVDLCP